MLTRTTYGISRQLTSPYDAALEKVKQALKAEGFGVLTEIDVQRTLREKLDVDFMRYEIIGACNPPVAYEALQSEFQVGLLLPCNVIVYEAGEGSVVAAFDPEAGMALAGNEALQPVAAEAKERLVRAIESL